VKDARYPGGTVEFLVEEELEGEYTKWWVGQPGLEGDACWRMTSLHAAVLKSASCGPGLRKFVGSWATSRWLLQFLQLASGTLQDV
jgi:hypothetical protein